MFSDYSWGDFIKVALCLLVPYYAFVAWKYYREDIREWLGNRGEKGEKKPGVQPDPIPEDMSKLTSGLFDVQAYDSPQTQTDPAPTVPSPAATEPLLPVSSPPATQPAPQPVAVANRPVVTNELPAGDGVDEDEEQDDLLVDGPVVATHEPVIFHFEATVVAPTETSLKKLVDGGQHLQKQEDGLVTAPDDDQAGNVLAGYINQQQKKAAGLEGISFNRR